MLDVYKSYNIYDLLKFYDLGWLGVKNWSLTYSMNAFKLPYSHLQLTSQSFPSQQLTKFKCWPSLRNIKKWWLWSHKYMRGWVPGGGGGGGGQRGGPNHSHHLPDRIMLQTRQEEKFKHNISFTSGNYTSSVGTPTALLFVCRVGWGMAGLVGWHCNVPPPSNTYCRSPSLASLTIWSNNMTSGQLTLSSESLFAW